MHVALWVPGGYKLMWMIRIFKPRLGLALGIVVLHTVDLREGIFLSSASDFE